MTLFNRRATDTGEAPAMRPVSNDSTEAEILQTMNHLLQSQERIEMKLEMLYQDRGQVKLTEEKINTINLRLNTIETNATTSEKQSEKQANTYRWMFTSALTITGLICTITLFALGYVLTHMQFKP